MKRLQQKCFIVSTGFHLLLALVFLTSSGFLTSNKQPTMPDMPVLDFVPLKTTDDMVSGGGERNVKSAAPAAVQPPPPAPAAKQPEKVPDPEPPAKESVEPVKTSSPEDFPLDPTPKATKRHKIDLGDIQPTSRKVDSKALAKAKADAEARAAAQAEAKRWADSQRRLARALGEVAENFGNGLSGGTEVRLQGSGGGGVPYANFLQAVKSVYTHAWIVPDGVTDDDATVTASVTIARDGSVISSRITRRSGNSAVDQSVQATLNRVRFAAPLPDTASEDQRTVSINFNVRAKRAIG